MPRHAGADLLQADILAVQPDHTYRPAIFVGLLRLDSNFLAGNQESKIFAGRLPVRLACFRRIDASQPDTVLPVGAIQDGHGVAVADPDHLAAESGRNRAGVQQQQQRAKDDLGDRTSVCCPMFMQAIAAFVTAAEISQSGWLCRIFRIGAKIKTSLSFAHAIPGNSPDGRNYSRCETSV